MLLTFYIYAFLYFKFFYISIIIIFIFFYVFIVLYCCFYFFFFVLLAHAGVWLLLNDILALSFPSSLSQKNTNLIKFGSKKCIFSYFLKDE